MSFPIVTARQVKTACVAAGITRIPHHNCGICGSMVFYSVDKEGQLWFNPDCDCSKFIATPEEREWGEASDWINMQSDDKQKAEIAKRFGLDLEVAP